MKDTYFRLSNIILSDIGKQLIIRKFKQSAANMGIIVKNIPIEVHYSIRLVKCYHSPFCQTYSIIIAKLLKIKPKFILQMFFKTFNNLTRLNGLVLTFLVFGTYFCITDIDTSSPTINQCSIAIYKTIEEVKRSHASRFVNNILNI